MAIVISVANQKGGVGKTTTCVNVGAGLGMRGYKTLLIDFDPQRSLSSYFALTEQPLNVEDWITGKENFSQVVCETPFRDLHVLPATEKGLRNVETSIQSDFSLSFNCLQKSVDLVRNQYEFILIDTLPSVSLLFDNSLVASDRVLVPAELSFLSMQGLPLLHSKISEVQQNFKAIGVLGVFGTKFRQGVNESEDCLAELNTAMPGLAMKTHVRLNSKVAEAAAHHQPIQYFDNRCPGSEDYENLISEVLNRCPKQPARVR